MKRETILITFGILLIAIGAFFLINYQSSSLHLSKASLLLDIISPSFPKRLYIKNSGIDVGVTTGGYKDGKWVLTDNYALYLPQSAHLGEGGNTILYAHNRKGLFGNLKKTSVGDIVVLEDVKGKAYKYSIYSIEYVKPYQIEKINTNAKDTVTLFTCDGWFDQMRLVVKAKIIS